MTEPQQNMVNDLLAYDSDADCDGINDWEMEFLNNIQGRGKALSQPQANTLATIYGKVFQP